MLLYLNMVSIHIILKLRKNGMDGKCKGIKRVQSVSIKRADFAFLYLDSFLDYFLCVILHITQD